MASQVVVLDPQKLQRRRQILDAAKHVFADSGYHGASIHAIIDRADIARGTFYLYFESKSAVFSSILDEAMESLRRLMHRIDVDDPNAAPPQVQLRQQIVGALEFVVQDRALAMLLLSAGHTPDAEAEVYFADTYDTLGPMGAKSMSESPYNPVAAAMGNALFDATGIRFTQVPFKPDRIFPALQEKYGK